MAKKENKEDNKGKTPNEIVHRHLKDKNDVISEDDFKEMIVGPVNKDNEEKPLDLPKKKRRPKDEEKDHKHVTPWDVEE